MPKESHHSTVHMSHVDTVNFDKKGDRCSGKHIKYLTFFMLPDDHVIMSIAIEERSIGLAELRRSILT